MEVFHHKHLLYYILSVHNKQYLYDEKRDPNPKDLVAQ